MAENQPGNAENDVPRCKSMGCERPGYIKSEQWGAYLCPAHALVGPDRAGSDVPVQAVREPHGIWHREAPTFRWEAPKRACDKAVLHPCEAATLSESQVAGEFMCPDCFPETRPIPPGNGGVA